MFIQQNCPPNKREHSPKTGRFIFKHCNPERASRSAIQNCTNNPTLNDTAREFAGARQPNQKPNQATVIFPPFRRRNGRVHRGTEKIKYNR